MKRSLLILSITLMAVAIAGTAWAKGEAQHPAVGTWRLGPVFGDEALISIFADGNTITSQDLSDFSTGHVNETTAHGVWEKTGPRSYRLTTYAYVFDGEGNHVGTVRGRTAGAVSADDANGMALTLLVDVFLPFQDWVSGEEEPLGGTFGPITGPGTRLRVQPMPEIDE